MSVTQLLTPAPTDYQASRQAFYGTHTDQGQME